MKRILKLFSAFVFSLLLAACSEQDDNNYIIDVKIPESTEAKSIIVSVPYTDGMEYVNIFRKDKEDVFNIGQIIPASKNKMQTYLFEDNLAVNDVEYQYCARFKVNGSYKITAWSDPVKISQATPVFTDDPRPVIDNCHFLYDKKTALLSLVSDAEGTDGSIGLPGSGDFSKFSLGLALSNGDVSSIFNLASAGSAYTTDSSAIFLRMVLTSKFFNKPLGRKGVVCQLETKKYEKADDSSSALRYTIVQWTAPVEISVKGDVDDSGKFTVEQVASDDENYDFSDIRTEEKKAAANRAAIEKPLDFFDLGFNAKLDYSN